MPALRLGLIGAGKMGRLHARALRARKDVELVAVVDPHEDVDLGVPRYPTCEALLSAQAVDAAVVASPTPTHRSVGAKLLRAGVPTLIEKPLALCAADGRALVELAHATGTALMVGHIERHNPAVAVARRWLHDGGLGQVTSVLGRRLGPGPRTRVGNNVISDLAIHELDLIPWLLGRAPQLVAARRTMEHFAVEEAAEIFMLFETVPATIEVSWMSPVRSRTLSISGTEGALELDYLAQTVQVTRGTSSRQLSVAHVDPLEREHDHFMRIARGLEGASASADMGLAAVELADAALQSANGFVWPDRLAS
jgi:UDP-N-acetylglucosamine 3-dehydrogenase